MVAGDETTDTITVVRNSRAAVLAMLIVAVLLLLCACTTSTATPTVAAPLTSPMPKAAEKCLSFPIRSERRDPSTMPSALDGHVPPQLPAGFGLFGLFQGLSEGGAYVEWDDASCGRIGIEMWKTTKKIPPGDNVGAYTLIGEKPPTCMRPSGPAPCFQYEAQFGPDVVAIYTTGLSRQAADRFVESVG